MTSIRLSQKVLDIPPSGIRAFFELVLGMKEVISLGVGEPDFSTPWNIRESAIFSIERGYTSYTSNKGMIELRREIAQFLWRTKRLRYDPETEILITVGVSEALDLAIRSVVNPGEKVLIPDPCYVSYGPLTTLACGEPLFIPTHAADKFKINRGSLKKCAPKKPKVLLLNYPSNPTGTSYSKGELASIAKEVERQGLYVISDEIYDELTYDGEHTPFPGLPGMKERTLYLNGFSKGYAMTGWRIGYACGPRSWIEAMTKIHQYTMLCASIMGQTAAIEALKHGGEAVRKMREEYRLRRNFMVKELNRIGLKTFLPSGAFYLFPSIGRFSRDSMAFAQKLLEKEKVAVVPGTAFGREGEGFIRISYASRFDHLQKAIEAMERFLRLRKGIR